MKCITTLSFTLLIALNSLAQIPGLSVKPVRLFYNLLNSQTAVQSVYVVNNTDTKQQFKLYFEDWDRDSSGGHIYMPVGTNPRSCAKWASINKEFLELNPGETNEILVKLKLPDSANVNQEMKWTMLFIQTISEKIADTKHKGIVTNVNNVTRIGVHVVQTPPTLTDKDLKMISFSTLEGNKNTFRIICQNTGKIQFDCKSYIELSNFTTGEKTTINRNIFPLFPNQRRCLDFEIPTNLPKGKYTAVGVLDGGDDLPLQASELTFEVPKK